LDSNDSCIFKGGIALPVKVFLEKIFSPCDLSPSKLQIEAQELQLPSIEQSGKQVKNVSLLLQILSPQLKELTKTPSIIKKEKKIIKMIPLFIILSIINASLIIFLNFF